jgi:hypothetical protein
MLSREIPNSVIFAILAISMASCDPAPKLKSAPMSPSTISGIQQAQSVVNPTPSLMADGSTVIDGKSNYICTVKQASLHREKNKKPVLVYDQVKLSREALVGRDQDPIFATQDILYTVFILRPNGTTTDTRTFLTMTATQFTGSGLQVELFSETAEATSGVQLLDSQRQTSINCYTKSGI